jgi:hypothetical protein
MKGLFTMPAISLMVWDNGSTAELESPFLRHHRVSGVLAYKYRGLTVYDVNPSLYVP